MPGEMGQNLSQEGEGILKEISWSELKAKKISEIKEGECLKVTGDGEMAFYLVVKPQGGMIARVEGIIGMIDASRGF